MKIEEVLEAISKKQIAAIKEYVFDETESAIKNMETLNVMLLEIQKQHDKELERAIFEDFKPPLYIREVCDLQKRRLLAQELLQNPNLTAEEWLFFLDQETPENLLGE